MVAISSSSKTLEIILESVLMHLLYISLLFASLFMYFGFNSYYWSFYYLHDNFKSAVIFFASVILDMVILLFFTFTLLVNPITKIIGVILSVVTVILLCLISSCYVFLKGEELATNMVKEIETINPNIPKKAQEILKEH